MVHQALYTNVFLRIASQWLSRGFILTIPNAWKNLKQNLRRLVASSTEIWLVSKVTPCPLMGTFSSMTTWKMAVYGIFFMVSSSYSLIIIMAKFGGQVMIFLCYFSRSFQEEKVRLGSSFENRTWSSTRACLSTPWLLSPYHPQGCEVIKYFVGQGLWSPSHRFWDC